MSDPQRANSTRSKARKRALDILFEADLRELDPRVTLADRVAAGEPPVRPFTVELVDGVVEHLDEIDAALRAALTPGWTLERMPRVDRCLARLALFELRRTDTPMPVVISEAVDLASELSTDASPAFLNALLDRAARTSAASVEDSPDQ